MAGCCFFLGHFVPRTFLSVANLCSNGQECPFYLPLLRRLANAGPQRPVRFDASTWFELGLKV